MQYPSGMRVNALMAGNNFGVKEENIIIGNGAAELINMLMRNIDGNLGVIKPTFDEYMNCYKNVNKSGIVYAHYICNKDSRYDVDDIITYFEDKDISALVLINPDNPSGNYIEHKDVERLIEWCDDRNIKLILDVSFIDFVAVGEDDFIHDTVINKHKNLYIIKSISKSYGVPGLRLGILVSGDIKMISKIKKEMPIWNINSFAEFYMQIMKKYEKDYKYSIEQFCMERERFLEELDKIKSIHVVPTKANFVMLRFKREKAHSVADILLQRYHILVKDLTNKIGPAYMRIAIKSRDENDMLINALREIFSYETEEP